MATKDEVEDPCVGSGGVELVRSVRDGLDSIVESSAPVVVKSGFACGEYE